MIRLNPWEELRDHLLHLSADMECHRGAILIGKALIETLGRAIHSDGKATA
jgi:hypothetical protein